MANNAAWFKQWVATDKGRVLSALRFGRRAAKLGDYVPCLTSVEEIVAALRRQNYRCKICGDSEQEKRLALDHCHATGRFRGWLCRRCNYAAGLLRDNSSFAANLSAYLS